MFISRAIHIEYEDVNLDKDAPGNSLKLSLPAYEHPESLCTTL